MIDYKKLRIDLRDLLLNVGTLPAERAWENRSFSPPNPPAEWVRETLLPGTQRLEAFNQLQAEGIYQIDVFAPAESGTEDVEDLAGAIAAVFKPGTAINSSAVCRFAEPLPGQQDGQWYHVPVQVSWRAWGSNT